MTRPSRQAGLFERYGEELAELLETRLDVSETELT